VDGRRSSAPSRRHLDNRLPLQSAASALSLAGADVVAAVVVGRVIRTDWSFTGVDWWSEMRQTLFAFDSCCLE
jgi:hypothetical protein